MNIQEGSIGVIFNRDDKKNFVRHYVIKGGKAKYISKSKWDELMKERSKINAPLYMEDDVKKNPSSLIRFKEGVIYALCLKDGEYHSFNDFREFEISLCISYVIFMEKNFSKYIETHPSTHFAIAIISKKYGVEFREIYYEDKVASSIQKKVDAIHDEVNALVGIR